MTIITVLVAYATLVATLALAISLLLLHALPAQSLPATSRSGTLASLPPSGPGIGSPVPPIRARTNTATLLDTDGLAGHDYLLAFLSSSCQGCRASLPILLGYADRLADPDRLIAVVMGERRHGADLEQRLTGLATVVPEADGGPIVTAYGITVFPSYVLVSGTGTVLATGHSVLDLPQPQPQ